MASTRKRSPDACARVELLTGALANLDAELEQVERRQAALNRQRTRVTGGRFEAASVESKNLVFALARLQQDIAATRDRQPAGLSLRGSTGRGS